ncbi:unnamed protein product [Durusdinium trenchii]|uniref:Ion transport domain-containing protein n=1 Tax=Durusdinium trenchii TaxID=1381693 RepID=A0ABP0JT03_9DINO
MEPAHDVRFASNESPQSRAAPELFDFVEQQHRALLEQLSQHFDREEGLVFGPKSEAVEDATLGPLVSPPLSRQDEEVIPTGVSGKIFELGMTAQPEADGDKEAPDPPELVSPRTAGSTGGVAARRSSWSAAMMDYESASSPKSTTSRNLRNVLLSNSEYNKSWSSKLGPRLDTASVLLISLNAVLLIAEYQIEGEMIGVSLRKGEEPRVLARDVGNFFQFMDVVFDFVFLVEWIICLFWVRSQHRSCVTMEIVGNTLLVICGLMEAVLIIATAWGIETSVTTFHVLHAIACLRVVRCFRVLRLFQGPQLLLTACNTFLHSLLWAMVFLLVFMLTFSLVLGNLLLEFFVDPNASDRYWVWERYGTTLRAMYTLFEITFSGSWPNSTRPLIEKVNAGLVLFFVVYITVVAFGLIRVITAVFLKDTLDAAANDADHQVTLRLQKKADYAQKLEAIFGAIDREGNGLITEERLVEALDYPVVRAYFQTLDLVPFLRFRELLPWNGRFKA